MKNRIFDFSILFLALAAFSIRPAHAYLDPNTGSFLLQYLVAGFLGGIFILKVFWAKIKEFFKRLFGKKKPEKPEKPEKKLVKKTSKKVK